jgi:hypothetical protein
MPRGKWALLDQLAAREVWVIRDDSVVSGDLFSDSHANLTGTETGQEQCTPIPIPILHGKSRHGERDEASRRWEVEGWKKRKLEIEI